MKLLSLLLCLFTLSLAQNETVTRWAKWMVGSESSTILATMDSQLEGYPFSTV